MAVFYYIVTIMAEVKILVEGYTKADSIAKNQGAKTCPTISLVLDKDIVMVVDPGMMEDQQLLVDALKKEGLSVDDVNIVCVTHSHIDHYRNVGMFKNAKVLEYFGLWNKGYDEDWDEHFSENIQILKTPGHDYSGITLFVKTADGVVAICGDVFWKENEPEFDQYATDQEKLKESRELVRQISHWIVPGHGPMYKTDIGQRYLKIKNGDKVVLEVKGNCKVCHTPFLKTTDKCFCQEWLCYRCCECEYDCNVCNCKRRQ